jgi:hypothetical protein
MGNGRQRPVWGADSCVGFDSRRLGSVQIQIRYALGRIKRIHVAGLDRGALWQPHSIYTSASTLHTHPLTSFLVLSESLRSPLYPPWSIVSCSTTLTTWIPSISLSS